MHLAALVIGYFVVGWPLSVIAKRAGVKPNVLWIIGPILFLPTLWILAYCRWPAVDGEEPAISAPSPGPTIPAS